MRPIKVITENFEMPADIYHALKKLVNYCTSCNKPLPPSTQPKKPSGSSEPQLLCDECFVKTL